MLEYILSFIVTNHSPIIFGFCSLIGGIMHYLKKYIKKETDVGITEWFGRSNINATLYTGIMFIFSIIGVIATGVVTTETGVWIAMYTGFITGYTIDSSFNSDGKQLLPDLKIRRDELNAAFGKEKTTNELEPFIEL